MELSVPMSPAHLTHVLFYTSQLKGIMPTGCSAIRAVAFILHDLDLFTQADDIVSRITPHLENSFVAAIVLHMEKIMDTSEKMDTLNSTLMDSCMKLDTASTAISQCDTTVTAEHTDHRQQLAGKLSDVKTLTSSIKELVTSHNSAPQCPSYREDLLSHSSPSDDMYPPVDHAMAQTVVKERQLLINLARDHPVSKQICSCKELITLFQTALANISNDSAPNLEMKSLTILHNRGILLEMLSKEAAQWLSVSSNLKNLSTATGGKLSIKAQTFNIVVPFLPTSMAIEEVDVLHVIKEDNKLPHRSIMMAHWIKPPCRRENEQCIAHAMFHCNGSVFFSLI